MPVIYNGKKIIPAPFVSIERKIERSGDGVARSKVFSINVSGTISAHRGSPDYQGNLWTASGEPPDTPTIELEDTKRLAIMREKIGALTELFDVDGKWFEIQPRDGSQPIKFKPRITDLKFDEGNWYQKVTYTIAMEADCIYFGSTEVCASSRDAMAPEENWSIEQADELGRTYRLTHSISATAKRRYDDDGEIEAEGWEIARDLVLGGALIGGGASLLGFESDKMIATGVLGLDDFAPFNHVRSQQIDEAQGRFSVTETWLCFNNADAFDELDGNAIEDMQVEVRNSTETGLVSVTINGTITGLLERDSNFVITKTRYENASDRWDAITASDSTILARAQSYVDDALNPLPLVKNHGINEKSGVITYNYEYDNRADFSNGSYLSELVTVSIKQPADVFARIGVIGRLQGPILQAIGSKTERGITVNAEIRVAAKKYGGSTPTIPTYDTLTKALQYIGVPYSMFVESDAETWVERTGSYSRSSTFIYEE